MANRITINNVCFSITERPEGDVDLFIVTAVNGVIKRDVSTFVARYADRSEAVHFVLAFVANEMGEEIARIETRRP